MTGKSLSSRALLVVLLGWLLAMFVGALAGCENGVRIEVVCHSGSTEIYRTNDADRAMVLSDTGMWRIWEHNGGSVDITGHCVAKSFLRKP